jgi:autoinducer 2-degrading protein
MYVVCVNIHVKPEHTAEFVPAMLENARATRQESGNVRYDLLQAEHDTNLFMLYEVYRNKDAFLAHQMTPHYLKWRDVVQDWMAERRQGTRFTTLFFGDTEE